MGTVLSSFDGPATVKRLSSVGLLLYAVCAIAQQTGRVEGTATWRGAAPAAGIDVVAQNDVMPRARTTTTDDDGRYALAQLIPGIYRLSFGTTNGASRTVTTPVLLNQTTVVHLELEAPRRGEVEELVVVGQRIVLRGRAALANGIDGHAVLGIPLGPDYRDVVKLAPGVQYTQDAVRGPSAGGSGQDNVYRFDGVDVSLPLFGTLSAEPSSHDIDQVTFERGGARAVGFNRSGGFAMDSTSRSGTDQFKASIAYTLVPKGLAARRKGLVDAAQDRGIDQDRVVITASGPIVPSRVFFYGSFFGPNEDRKNKATAYGPAKDFSSGRREYYGKLTYAPTDAVLLNASYRTSNREETGVSVGPFEADAVSLGGRTKQQVASVGGSWQTLYGTTLSFRYDDFALGGTQRPDTPLTVRPSLNGVLDVGNLDRMGYVNVPAYRDGADAFNTAIRPLVQRYGYLDDAGNRRGGGAVGAHPQINDQSFYRRSLDLTFEHQLD